MTCSSLTLRVLVPLVPLRTAVSASVTLLPLIRIAEETHKSAHRVLDNTINVDADALTTLEAAQGLPIAPTTTRDLVTATTGTTRNQGRRRQTPVGTVATLDTGPSNAHKGMSEQDVRETPIGARSSVDRAHSFATERGGLLRNRIVPHTPPTEERTTKD